MTKKRKENLKFGLVIGVMALLAVFSFSFVGLASSGITIDIASATFYMGGDEGVGFEFGGASNLDDLELDGYLTVGEDLTVSDDATVGDELTVDDAKITCVDQDFTDASTTVVALPATSIFSSGSMNVVSFTYNNSTAATSTHSVNCGVAANAFTSNDTFIDGLSVSTSTTAYEVGGYGTNGLTSQVMATTEYVTCTVTVTAAYDGAFLDGGNTFDGSITVCAIQ